MAEFRLDAEGLGLVPCPTYNSWSIVRRGLLNAAPKLKTR